MATLTRKPAIDDARIGDRKAQIAVSNIRQRIEALESLVITLQQSINVSTGGDDQITAVVNNLSQQIVALRVRIAALETAAAPQGINEGLLFIVNDETLDDTVRLVVVNAIDGDTVVRLPSGVVDEGASTKEISIYRRDQGSGGTPGAAVVSIVTQSGELVGGSYYETTLDDGQVKHFMAIGVEGWIEA